MQIIENQQQLQATATATTARTNGNSKEMRTDLKR